MILLAEINGETIEVPTEIHDSADVARALALCGPEPLDRMRRGIYDPRAARAIIYLNVVRALSDGEPDWTDPILKWGDFDLDWGEYDMLTDPLEMEADLASISKVKP